MEVQQSEENKEQQIKPNVVGTFKQNRSFKIKQSTQLMKIRVNQEDENSVVQSENSEGSEQTNRNNYSFLNETNTTINQKVNSPAVSNAASIFQKNKIYSRSLRGSILSQANQSDEKLNQSNHNSIDNNQGNISLNNPTDFTQQSRLSVRETNHNNNLNINNNNIIMNRHQISRSVYIDNNSNNLQLNTSKTPFENKSFYNEVKTTNTEQNARLSPQKNKNSLKSSSSVQKLPQINKNLTTQDNIVGSINQKYAINNIRQHGRNKSSTPITSISNNQSLQQPSQSHLSQSSHLQIQQSYQQLQLQNQHQQNQSNILSTPTQLKNQSKLNNAGNNVLTPMGSTKDNSYLPNSALFSSQKQLNSKKNSLLNSPLSAQANISKLKMQFYQQMCNSPGNSDALTNSYIHSNFGQDHATVQNINTNLRDMMDEKNFLSSLIGSSSHQSHSAHSNKNMYSYNSPLTKAGQTISFPGNNLFQSGNTTTVFSQALSSRIGQMNYLDESKESQSQNFHSTYKNISKMQQQSDHYNQDMELQQAILSKAYQGNVLPRKFGLIKQSENESNCTNNSQTTKDGKKYLNLVHLNIGSTYHHIVAAALVHIDFSNLYSINISFNNLTSVSVDAILQNLPDSISRIDLSNNHIGTNGASSIRHAFNSKKYVHLRYLNVSNNQLGDNGLKSIVDEIQTNTSIYSLDLSYNKLSDQACVYIQQILLNNSYIQELYLQWNKFSSRGGIVLAAGLASNYNMRVVNLSHNGLGSLSKLQSGLKFIQSCSTVESGMRHLDLSYNQYLQSEAILIADALKHNNKLFGFHFQGNQCHSIVDSRGYLYFQQESEIFNKNIIELHMNQRNIDNVSSIGFNKSQTFDCKAVDNCWLCDGWQEVKFEVKHGCSESFTGEPAFLHLDFEEYSPVYMDKDQDDPTKYVLYRMCPPGRTISFFFTDPCKNMVYTSKDYDRVNFSIHKDFNPSFFKDDEELNVSDGSIKKKFTVKYLDGSVMTYSTPVFMNVLNTTTSNTIILSQHDYESCIKCVPRQQETYYKINFSNQWHRGISLFRNYIEDSEEMEDKCFEEDWNNSKIPFIVQTVRGSNLDQCRRLLRLVYPQIRMCYKNLSVNGMSGDIFCISQNPYTIFVQTTDLLDNNLLKVRDTDLNFFTSSSKAVKTKTYRAPDKTLVRNEFLEVIVRLAVDKYNKSKIHSTVQQALGAVFLSDSFLDYIISFEHAQEWRNERYWNQHCDQVMRNNIEILKTLWNLFADSRKGEKRYYSSVKTMSIYEFRDFVLQFELVDDSYPEKEVNFTFNQSMMTQIDELNSDKYFQMNFEEFLEAIARIAEKKSLTPLGEIESEYKDEERKQLCLTYKLESFLYKLQEKYDKLNAKDKKKTNQITNQQQNTYSSSYKKEPKQSYINWESVIAQRRAELKQKLIKIIKEDETPNSNESKEIIPQEIISENAQLNISIQETPDQISNVAK